MKRLIGILTGLVMLTTLLVWAPAGNAVVTTTPACGPITKTVSGTQTGVVGDTSPPAGNNETWDLRGMTHASTPTPTKIPVRFEGNTKFCVWGGKILGNIPRTATRDQWYNGVGGTRQTGEAFRLTLSSGTANWQVIKDAHVQDHEDAYDPNSPGGANYTTYLDHVYAEWIRDDCVENEDKVHSLVIKNSLFNGCTTGLAEKPDSSSANVGTGPGSTVVEDSLFWIQPQPMGPLYCSTEREKYNRCVKIGDNKWLGAYGMFKWGESATADLRLTNVVIRYDQPSYSSCNGNRFPTNGKYTNVTLVWTGKGSWQTAGGCTNVVPAGVTLVTDNPTTTENEAITYWNNKVAAWRSGSASEPTPTPSPSPTC